MRGCLFMCVLKGPVPYSTCRGYLTLPSIERILISVLVPPRRLFRAAWLLHHLVVCESFERGGALRAYSRFEVRAAGLRAWVRMLYCLYVLYVPSVPMRSTHTYLYGKDMFPPRPTCVPSSMLFLVLGT
jgi:hypothetical protein